MDDIRLCKTLFLAEHLGGAFYDRFAANVDNADVAGTFNEFAGDEHHHAGWYAEWLVARGHSAPNPTIPDALILPGAQLFLLPQSLDKKLRTFARTEALAAKHLRKLAEQVKDPELKAIIERTIPSEVEHSEWYELEGKKMLRAQDSK